MDTVTVRAPGDAAYAAACETARAITGGSVILLVFDGLHGHGGAVQVHISHCLDMAVMLRALADDLSRRLEMTSAAPAAGRPS